MAADFHFSDGDVIEFADKGKFHLGVVTSCDAKSGKIKLINMLGRDMNIPEKQVLHRLPTRISTSIPSGNIQNELKSLDMRADNMVGQCDVEELWQLVAGEYDEIDIAELASLLFSEPDAVQMLAMIRAMRLDKIYFKALQVGRFAPRPADVVEELMRQKKLKEQKDAWRNRFIDQAITAIKMNDEERQSAKDDGYFAHSDVLDAWKIVEQYAVLGTDAQDRAEAETLLEGLQNRLNRGFSGTAYLRARAFLREAGYWEQDTNPVLIKYEIAVQFDDDVENQALDCYQKPGQTENRRDLTHLDIFSIDDSDTLDIDDALSIEKLEDGKLRLGVHIAAPASAIPFGSPMELAARHRATSIYLADQRIPMMPLIVSENALSLMPGMRRNAVSFLLTFDGEFNLVESEIVPSVVMSKHRLSYSAAEDMLEHGEDDLSDEIRLVQEICEYSAANRRNNGAIDIDLPEFKLVYHRDTGRYDFYPIDTSMMSRQLVSECMILANSLAADFCVEHDIPALYRIQPPPVNMPRQDTLDEMPNDMYRAFAMRRCMMPAALSLTPDLHAGLGLNRYLQATSPLRRYADLMWHYQMESWFEKGSPMFCADEFNAILAETDLGLSHARSASHEAMQTATLAYLGQLGSEPLDAMILQYNSERSDIAQVVLTQTQIRASVATKNRWPNGTMCRVRIDNVRPEEGVILLQFIDVPGN